MPGHDQPLPPGVTTWIAAAVFPLHRSRRTSASMPVRSCGIAVMPPPAAVIASSVAAMPVGPAGASVVLLAAA